MRRDKILSEKYFLIDYIGETSRTFYQRMKEHLIELIGGNYRICYSEMLLLSQEVIIWNGRWRKYVLGFSGFIKI